MFDDVIARARFLRLAEELVEESLSWTFLRENGPRICFGGEYGRFT